MALKSEMKALADVVLSETWQRRCNRQEQGITMSSGMNLVLLEDNACNKWAAQHKQAVVVVIVF